MPDFFKYFPLKYIHRRYSQKKTNVWILDPKFFKDGEYKIEEVWSWKKLRFEKFVIWKEGAEMKIKKVEEETRVDTTKQENKSS